MSAVVLRPFLLACSIAAALSALPARADQSDDLNRLREEAAKQRQDLEGTEARIRALEQRSGAQPVGSRTDSPSATQLGALMLLKQNWSRVEPGVPQERVQVLLGAPEKVLRIDGALVWYYVYPGIGPGSVFFNAGGKVSGRQAPTFGWW
ncbi:MAG TPA: hypothetical protein VFK92_06740 [Burkholderiales bacterium]|nr:hypothetical protein [Burkholderiales bacterium]